MWLHSRTMVAVEQKVCWARERTLWFSTSFGSAIIWVATDRSVGLNASDASRSRSSGLLIAIPPLLVLWITFSFYLVSGKDAIRRISKFRENNCSYCTFLKMDTKDV